MAEMSIFDSIQSFIMYAIIICCVVYGGDFIFQYFEVSRKIKHNTDNPDRIYKLLNQEEYKEFKKCGYILRNKFDTNGIMCGNRTQLKHVYRVDKTHYSKKIYVVTLLVSQLTRLKFDVENSLQERCVWAKPKTGLDLMPEHAIEEISYVYCYEL